MPKFTVTVTVKAECSYVLHVDYPTESKAEDVASARWRDLLPSDFQVEKGYITDWETEAVQLTWECVECEKVISEDEYRRCDELCESCFALQS
jgi:hypothetical protein